ncbi:MAG: cell division protein [Gammaproteobacteria bacterium RIFCSPHIGHO2_12_FULL_42_13]|nr:MAG: cell division protein [Gammaproteobacteria bacterium RIFCSPHIGHO2_12_FULL_42_13]
MRQRSDSSFIAWRFYLVVVLLAIAVAGLAWRVFDLIIFHQPFLRQQGDQRALRLVGAPAFRGMISDRNGFPLAISTEVYSVWVNPQTFVASQKQVPILGKYLNISVGDIESLVLRYQKKRREFAYLKRDISPEAAAKIKTLGIPGVYFQQEYRRFYPEGEVTAQLIGFTNIDDHGQEGLELAYNTWLAGENGKKWVIKDRVGNVINDIRTVQEQKPGHDLTLSIDRRIQYLAYRELMQGVVTNKARSGSAIVLDAKTGEVLAMVNYPSFNPNRRPFVANEGMKNRAVTDIFEPGSTVKSFSLASALESGKYTPDSMIDTSPGWVRVGHTVLRDEHGGHGVLSLTQILQISSNVGMTKVILSLPPEQLWSLLHRVGFGEATFIDFPGEQNGVLYKPNVWSPIRLATLSFGYGVSVTTLQLAKAYNVLANSGIKKPLSLLRLEEEPKGERVLDSKVAQQMLVMMESVFAKGGTAQTIHVEGYHVAGKTGTSWVTGTHGYEKNRYTSSFAGIAPASDPRLVIIVVIHDPQGKQYYGGFVSGPVFQRIMEGTLRTLDISPDNEVVNS